MVQQNDVELIKNGEIMQVLPSEIASILLSWKMQPFQEDIGNQENIDYLKNNSISDIIYKNTETFFFEKMVYFTNLIDSEKRDVKSINQELSSFFDQYRIIYEIYPDELIECLKKGYGFNDVEVASFIESCKNNDNDTIKIDFLNKIKDSDVFNASRNDFEIAFNTWLSDWNTRKLLISSSKSGFSKQYELFFTYLDSVYKLSENTEIAADLKNYVNSGWMWNDLVAKNPKKDTPQLKELRNLFQKFILNEISPEETDEFKHLLEKRQRDTLVYIRHKTIDTNNPRTTQVSILEKERFSSINDENRNFANGISHIMPKLFLDRARVDLDDSLLIHIEDVKSTSINSDEEMKTIFKNMIAALSLAIDRKIRLSCFSPALCPNIEDLEKSRIELNDNTNNDEIAALHQLPIIAASIQLRKLFNLTDRTVDNNFYLNKSNVGATSTQYKRLAELDLGTELEKVLSFFEKNVEHINETRWYQEFTFFLETLYSLHYYYEPKEVDKYKETFSKENMNRLTSLFDELPWYDHNVVRDLMSKLPKENIIDEQLIENKRYNDEKRDYSKECQERVHLKNLEDKYDALMNQDKYLEDDEYKSLQKQALEFCMNMWNSTYYGDYNERKEQLYGKYLLAKNFEIGGNKNTTLKSLLNGRYNGQPSLFKNQLNFRDLDKLYLYIERQQYSQLHELIEKLSGMDHRNEYPIYDKAQSYYLRGDGKNSYRSLMRQIKYCAHNIYKIKQERKDEVGKFREQLMTDIENMPLHPRNVKHKQALLDKLEKDKAKYTKQVKLF